MLDNWETYSDPSFEQTTVSVHVNQFMVDYMFVRDKLRNADVALTMDTGMGEADLVLSIVNDAYNQQHISQQIEKDTKVVTVEGLV
jgi:hypothetical protein